jgi:hypothetical protein
MNGQESILFLWPGIVKLIAFSFGKNLRLNINIELFDIIQFQNPE